MEKDKHRSIVLLSGGLDSAVAIALAKKMGWQVTLAVTFDYGQRAISQELNAARQLAQHFELPHETIPLPFFSQFPRHGLLSPSSLLPNPTLNELTSPDFTTKSADAVWVPNRNGVFLETAAALAEARGFSTLLVGFNTEEAQTFPDNSKGYLGAINRALAFSTRNAVKVFSPTIEMTKSEIVRHGKELDFPFSLLWSCYENTPHMCGKCESCMRLKRALKSNEVNFHGLFQNLSL